MRQVKLGVVTRVVYYVLIPKKRSVSVNTITYSRSIKSSSQLDARDGCPGPPHFGTNYVAGFGVCERGVQVSRCRSDPPQTRRVYVRDRIGWFSS